jgi:hypothetical protein
MDEEKYDLPVLKAELEKLFEALASAQVFLERIIESPYDGTSGKKLTPEARQSLTTMLQSDIQTIKSFAESIAMKSCILPLLENETALILSLREAAKSFEHSQLGLPQGTAAGSYTYDKLIDLLLARSKDALERTMMNIEAARRKSVAEFADEFFGPGNGNEYPSN